MLHKKIRAIRAILMLHKGYTKFIMPAGIMSSASINIIRSNPIISADLSGLSVIRSFIIRMNPVYDKTDGGLNGFHRSTSLGLATAQNLIYTAMLICNSSRDLSCEKVARKC